MASTSSEDDGDALTQWLRHRLSHERELLERRHNALLEDFQALLKQETKDCLVQSIEDTKADLALELDAGHVNEPDSGQNMPATLAEVQDPSGQVMDLKPILAPGKSSTNVEDSSFIRRRKTPTIHKTWLGNLVAGHRFEFFCAGLIFLNIVEMALEMQYEGFSSGYQLGYKGYPKPKEDTWPGMNTYFQAASWVFGIAYTVELGLKAAGLRWDFLCDVANLLDTVILLLFYLEKAISTLSFPLNTMILRMVRLLRILRLIRLVHQVAGLGQLLLMLTALKGCLQMLAWASVLLVGLQTFFAFVLHELLRVIVIDSDDYSMDVRVQCFEYFGTFSRALFSMFELSLANWITISRFLIEDVNEFFVIFALGYKLTMGFAVIGVVNACFIKETFKVVATDRVMMVIEKKNEKASFVKEMAALMEHADSGGDHDGTLTLKEFEQVCHDEGVKYWLSAQGLQADGAGKLFELMDDGSGLLETPELVKGVAKLKGPARSLDMAIVSSNVQEIVRRVAECESELQRIEAECHMRIPDAAKADGHTQLSCFTI